MENTNIILKKQTPTNQLHMLRLKLLRKSQGWLAKKLNVNQAYVSQYFIHGHYIYLQDRIERIITSEEKRKNTLQAV